jgi:hypothetical protein
MNKELLLVSRYCAAFGQFLDVSFVMPGPVPGIHVFLLEAKTWMAGHRQA